MPQLPSLVDKRVLRPAQAALALGLVSQTDLLRLKAIARVWHNALRCSGSNGVAFQAEFKMPFDIRPRQWLVAVAKIGMT